VQSASPGLPRAPRTPFLQRCVQKLRSIAAALPCGFSRNPTQNPLPVAADRRTSPYLENLNSVSPAARAEVERCNKAVSENPNDLRAQRRLAAAHCTVGREHRERSNPNAALAHFQRAVTIRTQIMLNVVPGTDPEEILCRRQLGYSHAELGRQQLHMRSLTAALKNCQAALDISRQLVKAPDDEDGQLEVLIALYELCDVQKASKDPRGALASQQSALELLTSSPPQSPNLPMLLVSTHTAIGDLQNALDDTQAALTSYHKALAILDPRVDAAPTDKLHEQLASLSKKISALG
jgi:tetratricopeptide (TPR) repeat protein